MKMRAAAIATLVVVLLLGSTALATPSKEAVTEDSVAQAIGDLNATIERQREPSALETQCAKGIDDRRSDLCAQWKAADAAREAVLWAVWSGLAVVVALILTMEANRIARETGKKQTRAYVGIEEVWLDLRHRRIEFFTKNFGQSEALNVRLFTQATVLGQAVHPHPVPHLNGTMDPGFRKRQIIELEAGWAKSMSIAVAFSRTEVLCDLAVTIEFRDVFDGQAKRTDKYNTCAAWRAENGRYPLELVGGETSTYRRTYPALPAWIRQCGSWLKSRFAAKQRA